MDYLEKKLIKKIAKLIKNFFLISFVFPTIIFLSIEGLFRLFQPPPASTLMSESKFPYPYRMHGFRNNFRPQEGKTWSKITTNSMGLRGSREYGKKKKGEFRIIIVGGSTVFGQGSDDDHTIASSLERLLNENTELKDRYNINNFLVINGGQGWYNSTQEFVFYSTELVMYQPDLFIVCDGYNDIHHALVWNIRPPINAVYSSYYYSLMTTQSSGFTLTDLRFFTKKVFYESRFFQWLVQKVHNYTPRFGWQKNLKKVDKSEMRKLVLHRMQMNWTLFKKLNASLGIKTIFSLQPILFRKKTLSKSEIDIIDHRSVVSG